MQVSSVILFRVSLFDRVIIDEALLQITNMGSTSSAQYLKRGQNNGGNCYSGRNCPVAPWLRAWLPFNYFKIASLEFPCYFLYVFSCLVLYCLFE